ncbi:MAG: flagellar basal-body MS-ring/collar protein FliF [Wenzhouxiangellaceae bacterium]|nr:flagellar basal-body MS-ring/collar protein FliF [Wenzhouxiangellaceae bacterium]
MAAQQLVPARRGQTAQASAIDQVPGLRQLTLLLGLAAAVAVGVWIVLWARGENYNVLFSNLTDRDAAEIVQVLQASQIPHRYEPGTGAVLVAADRVHEARLQLAGQDLPGAGGVGFEMYSTPNGLADSQFIESARYQRALEVELQRTISSISSVSSARVHLAIPKQTVFVRDRIAPSASVLINLYAGRKLAADQVESIVNLVAASVPDMEAGQVTVVDQNGSLLSNRPNNGDEAAGGDIDKRQMQLEQRLSRRVEDILIPLVGLGRVRSQVTVTLNRDVIEETQEIFNPDNQVIRSEQLSETPAMEAAARRGIPGALSNQPPGDQGEGEDGGGVAVGAAGEPLFNTDATRNFEIGRTIRHLQQPMGEIRRLSVAVVVDQRRVEDAEGNIGLQPYSEDELARMTALVRQAVGVDDERGDQVSVINAAFERPELDDADLPEPSILDTIDVMGILQTLGAVVIVMVLIFAVVRPTLRQLLLTIPNRRMALPQAQPAYGQAALADAGAAGGPGQPAMARVSAERERSPKERYEERINSAKQIVQQDPKRVAQVVRQWVNEDG